MNDTPRSASFPVSRQFLVQQAVLNAIHYWEPFYSRAWLKGWGVKPPPPKFHERILAEFRILTHKYEVAI